MEFIQINIKQDKHLVKRVKLFEILVEKIYSIYSVKFPSSLKPVVQDERFIL